MKEFESVDLRAGTILLVEDFPKARKAANKVTVDIGPELGSKRTGAQPNVRLIKSSDHAIGFGERSREWFLN